MFCKRCGKDLENKKVRFCPACGAAQEVSTEVQQKFILPKSFVLIVLVLLGIGFLLSQDICFHKWLPATCTRAKTCSKCGEVKETALLPHNWLDATCTEPSRCSQCGKSLGKAKNHTVNDGWKCISCGEMIERELTIDNYREYLDFQVSYSDIASTVRRRIAYNENGGLFHPIEIRIDDVNISVSPKKNVKFLDVTVSGNIMTSNTEFVIPYAVCKDNNFEILYKITINSVGEASKVEGNESEYSSNSAWFLLSPEPSNYFDDQLSPYFEATNISGRVTGK